VHLARAEEASKRRDNALAREELEKARALFEQAASWEGYARSRNGLGELLRRQGDYEGALQHLNAVLAMAPEKLAPGHRELVRAYLESGVVHQTTGRPQEALRLFSKALELQRSTGAAAQDVAATLRRMGGAHLFLGEDGQALELLGEAEKIQRAALGARHPDLASTLNNKGGALWGQGRFDRAMEAFEEAIAILEGQPGASTGILASAYGNLGNAYSSKGDYDEALALIQKALPLLVAERGASHPDVGLAHYNMAVIHSKKQDYVACVASAERALAIFVPALGERHSLVVASYYTLGHALTRTGLPGRALAVLTKALALQRALPEAGDRDSAVVYRNLAEAYEAKGDLASALRNHRQALALDVAIHGQRHPETAEDLVNLGELYLKLGDPDAAIHFIARAIAANDARQTGTDLDLDPELETAFSEECLLRALKGGARARVRRGAKRGRMSDLEDAASVYEHAAQLVERMRAGYRAEGSKLRISASATEVYDEAISNELELHRLTGDEGRLERAFRYAEKSKAGMLRDALNEAEARSFAGIPGAVLEQERRLRGDLASADQRLTQAQLDRDTAQDRLQALRDEQFGLKRDYDALLLRLEREYPAYYDLKYRFDTAGVPEIRERVLDGDSVLVEYFLGRERIFIFSLTRADLEVTSVLLDASYETELQELRRAIGARDSPAFARSAHRLYRMLLAPVEGRIAGKDLVIVPDGAMSTIPFEALLTREASPAAGATDLPYVLRDHVTSYAYSATILVQGLRRARTSPAEEFVGFAPAFAEAGAQGAPRPLPASRKEVTDVRALVAGQQGLLHGWLSGRARVYLGPAATESRLKSAGLERYRYVHLATHAIADGEHPGLSRLLLSREAGSADDGVLHLGEIYNLHLEAELVVLSACDTGLGRLARGEGMIGLTRGFLYAGARSLLVSLWSVSDAAASELVVDFYRQLLAGQPKPRALREAKLSAMARNPEYAKPYFWAPFILVGQ
jgi:CHAT domain-containing protein/tetratricopeptide (TPR) repeat protein